MFSPLVANSLFHLMRGYIQPLFSFGIIKYIFIDITSQYLSDIKQNESKSASFLDSTLIKDYTIEKQSMFYRNPVSFLNPLSSYPLRHVGYELSLKLH